MPEFDPYTLSFAQRNRRVADQNRQVAEQNGDLAKQWMAYAEKVKAKLSTVEQERDALRQQLQAMQARAEALDALQGKMAGELAKVSPSNPLVSAERRSAIVETAVNMACAPRMLL